MQRDIVRLWKKPDATHEKIKVVYYMHIVGGKSHMMEQFLGPAGSVVAGACCLGFAPLLAGLTAIGAGFLINDLVLIPIFVAFLGITQWGLYSSRKRHKHSGPFVLSTAAAIVAFAALWLFTPLAYIALATLFAASVWDMVLLRQPPQAFAS